MINIKKAFVKTLYLVLAGLSLTSCKTIEVEESDARPNIVLIMADDLGFSDLGCYGGEIDTPNLNSIAQNGLRFNSFYNTSRCCPSRAAVLTGLYPHQAGIGRMTMDMGLPGYRGSLTENTVTIAEVLGKAGYQTGMVGKWHVSETNELDKEKQLKWLSHQENYGEFSDLDSYPTARGFDKFYGNIWGVVDYFDPFALVNGTQQVKKVPEDFYYTDAIGDTAVAYIEDFSKSDKPFFLYVAHCAPHWPLMAPEELIEKYKDTYTKGWREIRQNRFKNLVEKGILKGDIAKLSEFMFPEQDWNDNEHQTWDARAMAVHAAMVDRLDKTIGDLVAELKRTGEYENTVLFFLSDNGASSERPSRYGPGFDRPGSTRSGEEIYYPVEKEANHMPGEETTYSGIGPVWANTLNAPFRYWKAQVYEGGITTPFIAQWPNEIKDKGSIRNNVFHVIDLMPTIVELAGAEYPKEFNDRSITPEAGISMVETLKKETSLKDRQLFWEHFGSAAYREGDWKIVRRGGNQDWELYNLAIDRTEMNNLASENPDKVEQMNAEWQKMAKETNVFPAPK